MGDSEVLTIRFHFDGIFVLDGSTVQYCNGIEGVSHIEKDKLSIPKLEGHLLDHTTFKRSVRMYWLPFGAAVSSGMRLLVDDKTCLDMVESVGSDGAVDIYTELIDVDMSAISETNIEDGIGYEAMFDLFRDENVMNLDPPITLANAQLGDQTAEDDNIIDLDAAVRGEDESDSEIDATGFTTDEDDEAKEIRTKYKAYMSTIKKRRGIPSDPQLPWIFPQGMTITI
jgi:alpha-galactosidase